MEASWQRSRQWSASAFGQLQRFVSDADGVSTVGASRQAVPGGGAGCGGRRCAPAALRCSTTGRAAELASFAALSALKQAAASQLTKRAARAALQSALLGAPDSAPTGHRLPLNHLGRRSQSSHSSSLQRAVWLGRGVRVERRGTEGSGPARAARFVNTFGAGCLSAVSAANAASSAPGPWARVPQGSRCAAPTASVARRAPARPPFAATTLDKRNQTAKNRKRSSPGLRLASRPTT